MKTTNKIIMNYEPLPIEITQNGGHRYKQLGRNVDTAVYEQRGHYGQLLGYEVIRIKKQKAAEMFGRKYPAKEIYPCSEDWGDTGIHRQTPLNGLMTWPEAFRRAPGRPFLALA
jgi:hypothetical protein